MNEQDRNNKIKDMPGKTESDKLDEIKTRVHQELLKALDLNKAQNLPHMQLYQECADQVDILLNEQQYPLSSPEKHQLLREVMDEVFGLGPLEEFLRDPTISDILVNGHSTVYIEREGRLEHTDAVFRDSSHLMQVIHRIGTNVGRRIDESSPMLDARLDDGSRVNAIIPPLSLDGPSLSIRRFGSVPIDEERLLELEAITPEMIEFLDEEAE